MNFHNISYMQGHFLTSMLLYLSIFDCPPKENAGNLLPSLQPQFSQSTSRLFQAEAGEKQNLKKSNKPKTNQ